MVNIQIHYMCGSMWRPATSLHTLYLWLFQFGSAVSPWNTTVIPAGGEGTSFSKPLWNYGEKGMRWSRTLWKTILIKATSSTSITSSFAIQKDNVGVFGKSVLNHVALTLKDTWMRLEPAPRGRINVNWHHMIRPKHLSSCNSAGGRIAKLLLVETRDIRSGNACFQMAVARKRQVSGHGFQFKILSNQSPLQVLEVCKGNFRASCMSY